MRTTLASLVTSSALCACGAGLGGAPAASIAPDTVSMPASPGGAKNPDPLLCDRTIDDFRSSPVGELPTGWETWRDEDLEHARRDRAFTVIREQDQRLLRVTGGPREITLGRAVHGWDFARYPVLEWRWRTRGSASAGESEPEALLARVGAVWLTGFPFVARRIEYTWSLRQPIAAQGSSRFGQDRRIVVASSESADGHWHTVRVDVRRHYEAIFSKNPSAPAGIAVTAPERTQGGRASVDYGDFKLCRVAARAPEAP